MRASIHSSRRSWRSKRRLPSLAFWGIALCMASARSACAQAAPLNTHTAMKLDAAERRHVIDAAAASLRAHYFDGALGRKMANALLAHERDGDDNAAIDGSAFAAFISSRMMPGRAGRAAKKSASNSGKNGRPQSSSSMESRIQRGSKYRETGWANRNSGLIVAIRNSLDPCFE